MEKIVKFGLPFDRRHKDPNKNYGISSLRIFFILKGKKGAVQVVIATNCYLKSVHEEFQKKGKNIMISSDYEGFSCWDVGYHARRKQWKDQTAGKCDVFKSKKCYYDGSALRGKQENVAENFIKQGQDWIWKYLERYYKSMFGELR